MPPKDFETVLIKHFYQEAEAQLYAAKLREHGIEYFLSNTNMNNVLGATFSTVGLHIYKKDIPSVKKIIDGLDLQKQSDDPDFSFEDADETDIEIEKRLLETQQKKTDWTYLLLIGLLVISAILFAILSYQSSRF